MAQIPTLDMSIVEDPDQLADRAADIFYETLSQVLAFEKRFVVALSGGTTPRRLHASIVRGREQKPWKKVQFLFSDERAVPPDHPGSNYLNAKETLFDHLAIEPRQVHRIEADDGDHVRAAREYSRLMVSDFQANVDLAILGMGEDGHTASLFPGANHDALEAPAIPTFAPPWMGVTKRVSFSLTQIRRARKVLVIVSGAAKAERLHQVVTERGHLPLQQVIFHRAMERKPTIILADRTAGHLFKDKK